MGCKNRSKRAPTPAEPPSVFLAVFGDTPLLRLLDFLVGCEDFDYPPSQIAHLSGVHYNTLRTIWPQLERSGIVAMTRKVGKAKMYQFNRKHPAAKKFREFYWTIVKGEVHKRIELEAHAGK